MVNISQCWNNKNSMVSHILEDWLYLCFPACSNVWSWGDWMQLTARALTETNDWGRKYITAFRMCPHHASNNYRRYLDTARWTAPRSSPRRLLGGTWSQKARPLGHTMTPLFFYSANFRFSAPLQWFNLVALLDFNNFIGAIWLKLWRHKRVIGGLWRSQKICIRHITAASFTTWANEKIFEKFGPQRVMWCNYKVWPLAKVGFQTWRSSWRAPSTVSFSHIPLIMWSVCFFF